MQRTGIYNLQSKIKKEKQQQQQRKKKKKASEHTHTHTQTTMKKTSTERFSSSSRTRDYEEVFFFLPGCTCRRQSKLRVKRFFLVGGSSPEEM